MYEVRKRLPLSSDVVFKSTFAKEQNKDLLKSLLEAILKIEIKNIEVKNPEIPKNLADVKAGVLDIKALINDDTVIDIEMQVEDQYNIDSRSTRYLTSMSSTEIKVGEEYTELKKCIAINILNFNFFKRNSYMNTAHMKFEENMPQTYIDMGYTIEDTLATDKLEMIFIELPKFLKKVPTEDSSLKDWLLLIAGKEDLIKMEKSKKEIKKAIEAINIMSADQKEWELYESRQKALMNYQIGIASAEERGKKAGFEEGKKLRKRRR